MTPASSPQAYQPGSFERIVAVIVAVLTVALVGYLVWRNDPFADPELAALTRIILALSVAVLGATIPGFLHIQWNFKGVAIRAGGALALFLLVFLGSPNIIPALRDSTIEPLKNPQKIGAYLPLTKTSSLLLVRNMELNSESKLLKVSAVYEGDGKPQRKYFDILISNSDDQQHLLSCLDSWDHIPLRSWPLFKARNVLRTLFQPDLSPTI